MFSGFRLWLMGRIHTEFSQHHHPHQAPIYFEYYTYGSLALLVHINCGDVFYMADVSVFRIYASSGCFHSKEDVGVYVSIVITVAQQETQRHRNIRCCLERPNLIVYGTQLKHPAHQQYSPKFICEFGNTA